MDRYTPTARERWQMKQSEPQPQGWVLALFGWIFSGLGFVFSFFVIGGLLGLIGLVFGILTRKMEQRNTQGILIIVISSVAIGIGLLIFMIFFAQGFVEGLREGYNEHY
ncbi:hypothetical protein NS115_21930 [Paenibacillus jamilae]|uniref:DUF4190 domain-containing protein n=2 Tax=Paenibacillus TaxID=44249 RepID=E3EA37_PAEPS|nr:MULTISPECIES: hypothetical protein [Paenibacillus]ADO58329.1 hypothetical protein PPSC2_20445 [Paenibacillus polymyxa SC2]AJE52579.1 hypothetical protein RE92_16760 [Paenibacillus polymyxa]AUO07392.1 hypothetical protein C0638_13020 [Paenibacillus sp. lzh-N1]AZH31010.1 hypothetical protein EGM68_20745 [Paenibacillus sp. M-152]KTS79968.1 hypothetical protein NS115_21930 [Paenibacillus jamilae]